MGRVKRLHFVGIGGVGMAPIAEILLREGYTITGSDLSNNALTKRLIALGATIYQEHKAENLGESDVLVYSSAVQDSNPELKAAKEKHIPILQRAQMLAELMRFRVGIAVAGTHGKTTTTSILASLFMHADLDPSYVIGGRLTASGTHAHRGQGSHIVVEADESDASFLSLKPSLAVVTNIDADHMSTYDNDFDKLKQAFIEFLHLLPFYGQVALCIDDPVVEEIQNDIQRTIIRYGFSDNADMQASHFKQLGMTSHFTVTDKKRDEQFDVILSMPGKHNVLNALAAIAIARECEIDIEVIQHCLKSFAGVGRRLQCHGELMLTDSKTVVLYDDYGHHPAELSVTIEALKSAYPEQRVIVVFQPHRYTRTQSLFDEFVDVLSAAGELILLPIFPAGESPIDGVCSELLASAIEKQSQTKPQCVNLDELAIVLQDQTQDKDVILMLGAGSIGASANALEERFSIQQ